jgi:pyruvate-formate lyase-activating enzyme
VSLFVCPNCQNPEMRRRARTGFLQTKIYPLFGFYPWECFSCRATKMLRSRGKPFFRRIWDE